jgi:hypothetical protein
MPAPGKGGYYPPGKGKSKGKGMGMGKGMGKGKSKSKGKGRYGEPAPEPNKGAVAATVSETISSAPSVSFRMTLLLSVVSLFIVMC